MCRKTQNELQSNVDNLPLKGTATCKKVFRDKKCETVFLVEAIIVFFTRRKCEQNELSLNLQKLLLSVTIKHNSDTNNLISCFLHFFPFRAFAMRNRFAIKFPFSYVEHELANVMNGPNIC